MTSPFFASIASAITPTGTVFYVSSVTVECDGQETPHFSQTGIVADLLNTLSPDQRNEFFAKHPEHLWTLNGGDQ